MWWVKPIILALRQNKSKASLGYTVADTLSYETQPGVGEEPKSLLYLLPNCMLSISLSIYDLSRPHSKPFPLISCLSETCMAVPSPTELPHQSVRCHLEAGPDTGDAVSASQVLGYST